MKRKSKLLLLFLSVFLTASFGLYGQVTIGSGIEPIDGALLDLKERQTNDGNENSTKGLMLPRVELSDLNKLYPMFPASYNASTEDAKHTGLVVYNLNKCLTVSPGKGGSGPYVWSGSQWLYLGQPKDVQTLELLASLYGTVEADGHLRIDIPSGLDARGPAILPFDLTVNSDPLASLATVTNTYNGGVVFNPAQTWTTGALVASPTVYGGLQATDMSSGTGAVTTANPWRTRETVLTFNGSSCPPNVVIRKVTLNQTNYTIKPSETDFTFRNVSDVQSFNIGANVEWRVKSIDDPWGIMTTTMTTSTTEGANSSDDTHSSGTNTYTISMQSTNMDMKYKTATITLEDTNVPKKAKDVEITCSQCLGVPDLTGIAKVANPDQTAAGDPAWDAGTTKADRVVLHLAKPNPYYNSAIDPAYMANIYEEFVSADFGPAGRWMVTNLAAAMYDGIRHSTDTDPSNPATSFYGPKRTMLGPPVTVHNSSKALDRALWVFSGTAADGNDETFFNADKTRGYLYTWDAATAGKGGPDGKGNIYNMVTGTTASIIEGSRKYYPQQLADPTLAFPSGLQTEYMWRIQGVCPAGWHIPSDYEWGVLFKEIIRNTNLYSSVPAINPQESIDDYNNTNDRLRFQTNGRHWTMSIDMLGSLWERCVGGSSTGKSLYKGGFAWGLAHGGYDDPSFGGALYYDTNYSSYESSSCAETNVRWLNIEAHISSQGTPYYRTSNGFANRYSLNSVRCVKD